MTKRYQVFVNSTYDDLKEERSKVVQALLNINCMPCGMEYFPASDEDAWNCIERLIPECDYYVVILAGKYGSIPSGEQKSYTQMEYELAVAKGVPVLGLLHKNPAKLPQERCESQPAQRKKLEAFRRQVTRKLCRLWETADQLPGELLASLTQQITRFPRVGWVRGDTIADEEAKTQIIALQRRFDKQAKQLEDYREKDQTVESELASGADEFTLSGGFSSWTWTGKDCTRKGVSFDATTTWDALVKFIRDRVGVRWDQYELKKKIRDSLEASIQKEFRGDDMGEIEVEDWHFDAIAVQLNALGIIVRRSNGWEFSAKGLEYASRLLAIKKGSSSLDYGNSFRIACEVYESEPDPKRFRYRHLL